MTNQADIPEEEKQRLFQMLETERNLWQKGVRSVAGVDEAGRGPLAGPVVAAAVIFNPGVQIAGVNDSKKMTAKRRECCYEEILLQAAAIEVGIATAEEIDEMNILRATHRAMIKAIKGLQISPDHLLVDGRGLPDPPIPQTALVGGDAISFSIAAASIVAKVTRDRMMVEYDQQYPEYGFAKHKGYGTKAHVEAVQKYGPSPIHRSSFHVHGWGK